jgi:predicted MFS family arabinose efflux permease
MSLITSAANRYIQSYKGLSRESWMLSIVMFINRSGAMVLPFMTMFITSGLGYTLKEAGYVMSCFGIGSLIGSWLGGWLTDRVGSYRVQWLSLFLSVPLYCVMPHFRSLEAICIALLLLSTVTECLRPANSVAIQLFAKKENLTRAFSLNRLALNLGFSVGPGIGGFLMAISFDLLFYMNAIGNLLAGIVFVMFFRGRKKRNELPTAGGQPAAKTQADKSPYTDGPFLLFTLVGMVYCVGFLQLLNTVPVYYKSVGFSDEAIGFVLAYSGLVIVLLEMPLVGILERKWSTARILMTGTLLSALSYFVYNINPSLAIAYLSLTLLSVGEILVFPFMSTVTALRSGDRNRGAYMGMQGLSVAIGFIIAPLIGTTIADSYSYDVLWYIVGGLLVVGAVGFWYTTNRLIKNYDGH